MENYTVLNKCLTGVGGYRSYGNRTLYRDFLPGSLAFSSGFSPAIDSALQPHIGGECSDASYHSELRKTVFPQLMSPWLQFAPVSMAVGGYSTLSNELPTIKFSIGCSEEERDGIIRFMNQGENRDREYFSIIEKQCHAELKKLATKITDLGMFTEPFTLYYALRLKNGEHVMASAPITVRCNDYKWKLGIHSINAVSGGVSVSGTLMRQPYKLAVSLPNCSANRLWKSFLEISELAGGIEAIDIFGSAVTGNSPTSKSEAQRTSGVLTPWCSSSQISGEKILFNDSRRYQCPVSIIYPMEKEWAEISDALEECENFRLIGSIELDKLSGTGWEPVELDLHTLFAEKATVYKPDYESQQPGEGYLMLQPLGHNLIANPQFGFSNLLPPACGMVYSEKDLNFNCRVDGDNNEEESKKEERRIILGIRRNGMCRYYHQPDTEGWPEKPDLATDIPERTSPEENKWARDRPRSLFHIRPEVEVVIEHDIANNRHRIFYLDKTPLGNRHWSIEKYEMPEWKEGSPKVTVESKIRDLYDSRGGTILCSSEASTGYYPAVCRSEIPDSKGVTGLEWHSGSSTGGKHTLLCFTEEGVWRMGMEEFSRNEVSYRTWRPTDIITLFSTYSHRSIVNLRNGVAFISGSGVMLLQGSNTRRLSSRGKVFPPTSILVYHPEIEMLEVREKESLWWYDLEKGEELSMRSESDPETLLGKDVWAYLSSSDKSESETSTPDAPEKLETYNITSSYQIFITEPFLIENSNGKALHPVSIRIAGSKGIGNYTQKEREKTEESRDEPDKPEGKMVIERSRDLHNWHTLKTPGVEIYTVLPEAYVKPSRRTREWWRISASIPKEWGNPKGIEIGVVDNL